MSAAWRILHKDLVLELRTREALSGLVVLMLLVLLTFTFAMDPEGAANAAPAVQWVTFVFAGLMAIQRAFLLERENGAWYGLLLCPIDRGAIFVAKMASNVIVLGLAQVVLMALLALLLGASVLAAPAAVLFVNLLGLIGFAALATLFAAISVRLRAREMMLPLLVLPLLVPLVICAVEASRVVMSGGSLASAGAWLRVLAAFDVIFSVAGWMVFEHVVQE
ncbi:MAG: heme exporter protein CcmB [Deltaproteobacteria bacterium]|nr:heme exporter protein CcmB [Deltaproteobacteria bacterium]